MAKKKNRVSTDGGDESLGDNPFGSLDLSGLPKGPPPAARTTEPVPEKTKPTKSRGRVDVIRQRSAGGGGWMTVAKNFVGISSEEKNALKKQIQKRCGVGGSLKGGNIEIQGDKREEIRDVLEKAGFRVVFAGG